MAKDILARMKERAPSFTKGQRAIAGYILDTFEKAAFLTAGRLCLRGKPGELLCQCKDGWRAP